MKKLGLLGYPLTHSFSKKYYLDKFAREKISGIDYDLYNMENIADFPDLYSNDESFIGVNVTIPHKIAIIPYLDELAEEAQAINAVNCIRIVRNQQGKPHLTGYNTDFYGFMQSIKTLILPHHKKALVLGDGGATKAVKYALDRLQITYTIVSRKPDQEKITYQEIDKKIISDHPLIINCTPLGTFPNIEEYPEIPYEYVTERHLLYDLIYNPEQTMFLKKGSERGAMIKNGYDMLVLQAEKNWEIWNES